ncbi:hypothetical protein [Sporosarcina sp. SAFN-010]|uniref:hypothetical protein n=1 Tax=Sporosarcina sp. SAFN-010 TaxID=3387273 RepID=UPI003F7FCEE0
MKKLYPLLALCFLLILGFTVSAQEIKSSKVLTYHGESENWSGAFTTEVLNGVVIQEGILKYKGQDIDSTGPVSCSFETTAGGLSSTSRLAGSSGTNSPIGEKGTHKSTGKGGNINLFSKVEIVKVTVKWDGKVESFILYKQ